MAGWPLRVKALLPLFALGGWLLAFRLFALTVLTYFLVTASRGVRLSELEEAYSGLRLAFASLATSSFVTFVAASSVLTGISFRDLFPRAAWARRWGTGAFEGIAGAAAIFAGLYFSGTYRYLGFLVHFEEGPWAWVLIGARVLTLLLFTYAEEFWFRGVVLPRAARAMRPLTAILAVALGASVVRLAFFDLGLAQLGTLFLFSTLFGLRALRAGDWLDGAGRWFGLLVVWHPILGLPIFGCDFPGTFLMRYSAGIADDSRWLALLTGGGAGPLSSLLLQALLAAACAREASEPEFRKRLLDARMAG